MPVRDDQDRGADLNAFGDAGDEGHDRRRLVERGAKRLHARVWHDYVVGYPYGVEAQRLRLPGRPNDVVCRGQGSIGRQHDTDLHDSWNPNRSGSRGSRRKRCSPVMNAEPSSCGISSWFLSTSRARNARPSRFSHVIQSPIASRPLACRFAIRAETHDPHGERSTELSRKTNRSRYLPLPSRAYIKAETTSVQGPSRPPARRHACCACRLRSLPASASGRNERAATFTPSAEPAAIAIRLPANARS